MNKATIITGGAQGIGNGISRGLLSYGANVLVVDIQGAKLKSLMEREPLLVSMGRLHCMEADITDAADCKKLVDKAVKLFGGIDSIVNCAAPSRNRNLEKSVSLSELSSHQKLVIEAPIFLAEEACEYLAKSSYGSIVNISSTLGKCIANNQASAPYHVTKAGLEQLTRWMAVKYGEYGVRVNAIAPGLVDREDGVKLSDNPKFSNLIKGITPLKRAGTYEDITNLVAFLCSDKALYITGQIIVIDGGLSILDVFGSALIALNTLDN